MWLLQPLPGLPVAIPSRVAPKKLLWNKSTFTFVSEGAIFSWSSISTGYSNRAKVTLSTSKYTHYFSCRQKVCITCYEYTPFDIHGSLHHRWLSRNTNKMQLCNRIYYSKVYRRLNMFRAAHRSSSGALNCICSLWFIYLCGDQSLPLSLGNDRSPHGYINQRLQIQFRAPDDERCAARNMLSLQ